MRLFISLIIILGISVSCSQQAPGTASKIETTKASTGNFGEIIKPENAVSATELVSLLNESDTINTKLAGVITASCTHTGCWMDVDMGGGESVHVLFKDDAYTIPTDASGKNAVFSGLAFKKLIPVETLKNYARDEGKSSEEINAITQPEWEYNFVADGVIISE